MLALNFEGWFQCRLATDPDPSDEPRGVSGWTFAMAGEEDLDRIIRLQEPVSPRSHGPEVGVVVRTVSVDERPVDEHPLVGALVELLDEPRFEGRNGIVSEDAAEFIHQFHLRVRSGDVTLRRQDVLDARNPGARIYEVDPAILRRRQPVEGEAPAPAEIADATGIFDFAEYRRRRREKLEADLEETDNLVTLAALEKRIEELQLGGIRVGILGVGLSYRFAVRGPGEVVDEQGVLGGKVATGPPWPIEFWMGGWDADALCGYMRGKLRVPFWREMS
jgi:hypothetical protein